MEQFHNKYYNHNVNWSNIIREIYKDKYNYTDNLENIHELLESDLISNENKEYYNEIPIFGQNDRKSFLVKDFHKYYDSNDIIKNTYQKFIVDYIKPIFNNEKIVYQTTPNIRFHLPNCTNIGKRNSDPSNEIIGLHRDNEFGHPSSELNVIIPITDMLDSNSIFFNNVDNSLDINNFNNLKLKNNQFFTVYFNNVLHYNKINTTNKTRVSFDFRVIPYNLYEKTSNKSTTFNKKFITGDYYSII